MSVSSAVAKKIIPSDRDFLGGYRSLAEMLNAQEAERRKHPKRVQRQRRREMQLQEQLKSGNNTEAAQHGREDDAGPEDRDSVS